VLAVVGGYVVHGQPYYEDEQHHAPDILRLLEGDASGETASTIVPGYHVVLAALGRLTGVASLDGMRLFTLAFSLLSALVFYTARRRLCSEAAPTRTLQYFVLPILFPLFFMVYTDSMCLLVLLLAVWAYGEGRFTLAGLLAGASLFVRQTNVVWSAMLFLMIYIDQHGLHLSRDSILTHLRRCWVFAVGFLGFVAFVVWNGGVAVGAFRHQHQAWPPQTGNVFFSLIVLFVLFLPSHVGRIAAIRDRIRKHRWILPALAAVFVGFMLGFKVSHPWNIDEPWYLRNRLLDAITHGPFTQASAFVPIAVSLLSLSATRMLRASMYLLYPFWIASLLPIAVIAPRYQIIPVVLFLLFKDRENPRLELATAGYLLLLTAVLSVGVFAHRYTL
jgi:alpha-1,2-glucosyltransferase